MLTRATRRTTTCAAVVVVAAIASQTGDFTASVQLANSPEAA